jgi:hypothetical protein
MMDGGMCKCPTGKIWNGERKQCEDPPTCDPGFHLNDANVCEADEPEKPPLTCDPGFHLNSIGTSCIADTVPPSGGSATYVPFSQTYDSIYERALKAFGLTDVFGTGTTDSEGNAVSAPPSPLLYLMVGMAGFYLLVKKKK